MAEFDPFDALRDAARLSIVPDAADVRARGRRRQVRARVLYVGTAVVVLVTGGGFALAAAGGPGSVVGPPATSPTSTAEPTSDPTPTGTTAPTRASDVSLAGVDFANVTVPGAVCGLSDPVALHDGTAKVADPRGYPDDPRASGPKLVKISWQAIDGPRRAYPGALDGSDDALLPLSCDNNGGGPGVIENSLVVLSGKGGLHVLGVVTAQRTSTVITTLLGAPTVKDGVLTVPESYYRADDLDCCPQGRAFSAWRWDGTSMVALRANSGTAVSVVVTVTKSTSSSVSYTVTVDGQAYQLWGAEPGNQPKPVSGPQQVGSIHVKVDDQEIYAGDAGSVECHAGAALVPTSLHMTQDQTSNAMGQPLAFSGSYHTLVFTTTVCDAYGVPRIVSGQAGF